MEGPTATDGAAGPKKAAAPAPPVVRIKECPFCLTEIPEIALECPACRRRIAGAGSPADFRRRLLVQELVLRQAMRDQQLGSVRGGLLGSMRLRTLAASGATAACLTAKLVAVASPELTRLAAMAVPGGILALALLVYFVIGDLFWLSARRRRHPAAALTAFVRAMEIGRYDEAYACVLPGDHNKRPRLRRAVHSLNLGGSRSTFADLAGFRAYWQPVFSTPDSSVSLSRPQVVMEEGDFAVVATCLSVSRRAAGWGGGLLGAVLRSAMAKEDDLALRKLVRRVDGRWYLVNGEMKSPEDHALKEFAVLASASDQRLVELCRQSPPATPTDSGEAAESEES